MSQPAPDALASAPTILLVEDSPDDVVLTRRAFRKAGLAARLAVVEDGEQAIDYLSGRRAFADRDVHPAPVLVLLDLKLPRRSGLEVLGWLREQPAMRTLPVVVLTSSKQIEDVERAYAAGANSYIEKPVAFESLLKLVDLLHGYWLGINVPSSLRAR